MKTTTHHHRIFPLSLIFLLLSPHITIPVEAQSGWGPTRNANLYPHSRFSSSLAIIIAVLITSMFFIAFFFIYIRYCTSPSTAVHQSIALRAVVVARGLDASVIETFPHFFILGSDRPQDWEGALECAVCLNEFEDDETLRLIPKCDHVFHPECIDAWLESHVTCPVCRADLVPQPGDCPVHVPGPTDSIDEDCDDDDDDGDDNVDMINSRNDEIVIQVDDIDNERHEQTRTVSRNLSFQYPDPPPKAVVNRNLSFGNLTRPMNRNMSFGNTNRMARSWSMRPRMFGLGKLGRSRSTGNILVQPGEDLERFTLRLPTEVRKEVINRASLNRTRSFAPTSRGKDRADNIGRSDREVKSDRWEFFTRVLSMKLRSSKGVAETGESSGSTQNGGGSRTLNRLRSFSCLVPRAADETGLIAEEPVEPTA